MTNEKRLFIIGACSWLLSDLLSEAPNMALLRSLKQIIPSANYVSLASLHASRIAEACKKYEKDFTNADGIKAHFPDLTDAELKKHGEEITAEFAQTSDLLYGWLLQSYKLKLAKAEALDKAIKKTVEEFNGGRISDIDLLLEWIASQPSGAVALETIRNKAIEIKNK